LHLDSWPRKTPFPVENRRSRVVGVAVLETDHNEFANAAKEALWQWEFVDSARPLPDGKRQVKVPIRFMIAGT
jgi:hypothetical protein